MTSFVIQLAAIFRFIYLIKSEHDFFSLIFVAAQLPVFNN